VNEPCSGKIIILCGLPGSGKTVTGMRLAEMLKIPFVDLDEFVEKQTGRKIMEIFAESGEENFRNIEAGILEKLFESDSPRVIALGGGSLESERARTAIRDNDALAVWLIADPYEAAKRLEINDMIPSRPLLMNRRGDELANRLGELIEKRSVNYEKCELSFETNGLSPVEVARRIVEFISEAG
jgi:shikimate kinase